MNKLLPYLLFLCFFISSCAKVNNMEPEPDYRFEVSCNNCTINIRNGDYQQSYDVQGYLSIPYDHYLPIFNISLWTYDDEDQAYVRFVGSGYNTILYDSYLYYGDPPQQFQFNL